MKSKIVLNKKFWNSKKEFQKTKRAQRRFFRRDLVDDIYLHDDVILDCELEDLIYLD